jgi:hypothetical protein
MLLKSIRMQADAMTAAKLKAAAATSLKLFAGLK